MQTNSLLIVRSYQVPCESDLQKYTLDHSETILWRIQIRGQLFNIIHVPTTQLLQNPFYKVSEQHWSTSSLPSTIRRKDSVEQCVRAVDHYMPYSNKYAI